MSFSSSRLSAAFNPIVMDTINLHVELLFNPNKNGHLSEAYPQLFGMAREVFSASKAVGLTAIKPIISVSSATLKRLTPAHIENSGVYYPFILNYMNLCNAVNEPLIIVKPGVRIHPIFATHDGAFVATNIAFDPLYNNFGGTVEHFPLEKGLFSKNNFQDASDFIKDSPLVENVVPWLLINPAFNFAVPVALFLCGKTKGDVVDQAHKLEFVRQELSTCRNCLEKMMSKNIIPNSPPATGCPNDPSLVFCIRKCICKSNLCTCPCETCRIDGATCESCMMMCFTGDGDPVQASLYRQTGNANTAFALDPNKVRNNISEFNLSRQVGIFDVSHSSKNLRNAAVNNVILVENTLVSTHLLIPLLDDPRFDLGIVENVIFAVDKMDENLLKKLVNCLDKIYKGPIIWTRYPHQYGEVEGTELAHGNIISLAASLFNVDFILAPIGLRIADAIAPLAIWRSVRTKRTSSVLLIKFRETTSTEGIIIEPTAIVLLPGKKCFLLVLSTCPGLVYILENTRTAGGPSSKTKPTLWPLLLVTATPPPILITVAFYPGELRGVALSKANSVYRITVKLSEKKVGKSSYDLQVLINVIPAHVGLLRHIAVSFDSLTAFVASSFGVFKFPTATESLLVWSQVYSFSEPVVMVGITLDNSIFCVTDAGDMVNLKTDVRLKNIGANCMTSTGSGVSEVEYHDAIFECATSLSISSLCIVENSVVLSDGPNIRIISKGSALYSLLRVIQLKMQAFGYIELDGSKEIKLPEGVRRFTEVNAWFQVYEEQCSAAALRHGVKSITSLDAVDGFLTSAGRQTITLYYTNLIHLLTNCLALKIENRILMKSISSVNIYIYIYSIYYFFSIVFSINIIYNV